MAQNIAVVSLDLLALFANPSWHHVISILVVTEESACQQLMVYFCASVIHGGKVLYTMYIMLFSPIEYVFVYIPYKNRILKFKLDS